MKNFASLMLACAICAGCTGSEGTDAPVDDAAIEGAIDARAGQDDTSPVDHHDASPADIFSDAPMPSEATDGDASCVAVTNGAAPVDEANSTDPVPTAVGGAIVDGTYFSTQVVNYGDPDAGYGVKAFRETVLVSNGMMHLVRDAPALVPTHVEASATYAVAGNQIRLVYVCGPVMPGVETTETRRYTSATHDGGAVELTIFDGQHQNELVVFSRQ